MAITISLLGLFLLCVPVVIDYFIEKSSEPEKAPEWFEIILSPVVTNIACSLFIAGIVSLGIEYFGFIDYANDRLSEILIEDKYLEQLTDEKLNELKDKAEKKLLSDINIPPDSFYYIVQNKIKPLISTVFLNTYEIVIDCEIDRGVMKKCYSRTMEFDCLKRDECTELFGETINFLSLRTIRGYEKGALFSLESFCIDRVEYVDQITTEVIDIKDMIYDAQGIAYIKEIKDKLIIKDKPLELKTKFISIVPVDDNVLSIRVPFPTKYYSATLNYNKHQFKVRGEAYGFMDSTPENLINVEKYSSSVDIKIKNWLLPGDGSLFIIDKI